MLSSLTSFKFHALKCFKSVEVSKVSNKQRHLQLSADIKDIASDASKFVHHLVRISPTAVAGLKRDHANDRSIDDHSLTVSNSIVNSMRNNMLTLFKDDLTKGVPRHCALVHAHSEYAIEIMHTKTGNCSEQALLAGLFIKATMETRLKLRGYSEVEIKQANICLTIAENGNYGGDHTVCVLSYDIDGKHSLNLDPWLKGSVYTQKEAGEFYAQYLVDPDESFCFDKVYKDKTFVINDDVCVSTVIHWAANKYDIDLNSAHPFDNYIQH